MKPSLLYLVALGILAGCQRTAPPPDELYGYAEAEWTHLAAPSAGYLDTLDVRRGDTVTQKQPVAHLDPEPDAIAAAAAQARVAEAEAHVELAEKQHRRAKDLLAQRVYSQGDWDEATEKVNVARRGLEAARRLAQESSWRVSGKTLMSPLHGWVHDTYFTPGEWVPADRPVLTLVAAENIFVRAFASQAVLSALSVGAPVTLETTVPGKKPLPAHVSRISAVAEYVPPVLYARDTRDHLMFALEIRPDRPAREALRPGEPVTVHLAHPAPRP